MVVQGCVANVRDRAAAAAAVAGRVDDRAEDVPAAPDEAELNIYMEQICEEIKDDMHKIKEDSKKIDCYAILDLILHSFICFIDSIKCCFKIKYYNNIYYEKIFKFKKL